MRAVQHGGCERWEGLDGRGRGVRVEQGAGYLRAAGADVADRRGWPVAVLRCEGCVGNCCADAAGHVWLGVGAVELELGSDERCARAGGLARVGGHVAVLEAEAVGP